jgi:hypothetical protein
MRRIVASLFLSLDGVAEAPNRWVFPYFDEAVGPRRAARAARRRRPQHE